MEGCSSERQAKELKSPLKKQEVHYLYSSKGNSGDREWKV